MTIVFESDISLSETYLLSRSHLRGANNWNPLVKFNYQKYKRTPSDWGNLSFSIDNAKREVRGGCSYKS